MSLSKNSYQKQKAEKDYSHREVVDKLGVKIGSVVAVNELIDEDLRQKVMQKTERPFANEQEQVDVVLLKLAGDSDPIELLQHWRTRLQTNGGIWLLTAKKSQPDYIDQRHLIECGSIAGLVDNKICSISNIVSAMRFVIRRQDR